MPAAIEKIPPPPDPLEYVPPFVSQRPDLVGPVDDCTWASGLMLMASWTFGDAVRTRNGRQLDSKGLVRRRLRMRKASGDTDGSNLIDLAGSAGELWPQLERLEQHTSGHSDGRLAITFEGLWKKLQNGYCAVIQGNPIKVTNKASAFRSAQPKDDYSHAIFVHRVERGKGAWIMDPLNPRKRYRGDWASKQDVREFMSEYGSASHPYCTVVKRGDQSVARLAVREEFEDLRRRKRQLKTKMARLEKERDQAIASAELVQQELDQARARLDRLEARLPQPVG